MHRIDVPSATVDHLFTEGSPTAGVPATQVSASWMNDVQENIMAVLSAAGVTPTKGRAADLLDAIVGSTKGRLIGVQTFNSNGTYTPTAGTTSVVVEGVGGGGGSGGVPATSASQGGISASGSPGAYAKGRFTTGFSGVAVGVGTAGAAGTSSGNGGSGGTTSFGALMSIPGGGGSPFGQVGSSSTNSPAGSAAGAPTGGNIASSVGVAPQFALLAAPAIVSLTQSVFSLLGKPGSGGTGGYAPPSTAASAGTAGNIGTLIIWEYA